MVPMSVGGLLRAVVPGGLGWGVLDSLAEGPRPGTAHPCHLPWVTVRWEPPVLCGGGTTTNIVHRSTTPSCLPLPRGPHGTASPSTTSTSDK